MIPDGGATSERKVECGHCGHRYRVRAGSPHQRIAFRCKECGEGVVDEPMAAPTLVQSSGAPTVVQAGSSRPDPAGDYLGLDPDTLPELELPAGPAEDRIGSEDEEDDDDEIGFADEDTAPMTEIPTRRGPVRIECELGRGGMGVVYKGRQDELERTVAIKMVLPTMVTPEMTKRFDREGKAVARLDHPNIVKVFDTGRVPSGQFRGSPFLIMEFIDGIGLDTLTRAGAVSPEIVVPLLRDVARAVDYAHDQGIVHRDLKPANIMISKQNVPKVMDFGLAKDVSNSKTMLSMTGDVIGTPEFMSPEQAMGRMKNMGPRSDIYSLGAILYAALTGKGPAEGDSIPLLLRNIVVKDPVEPHRVNPNVSADLSAIVMMAMEKDPIRRYDTAGDLADDLDRCLAGEPVNARLVGPVQRLWRFARRRKGAAALVAGCVLVVAGALAVAAGTAARPGYLDMVEETVVRGDPEARATEAAQLIDRLVAEKSPISGSERQRAVKLLGRFLADGEPAVRRKLMETLEQHMSKEKARDLVGSLRDSLHQLVASPATVKEERIRALRVARLSKDFTYSPAIMPLLHHPDDELRLAAIEALGDLGDRKAYFELARMALSDSVFREEASRARSLLGSRIVLVPVSFGGSGANVSSALDNLTRRVHQYHQRIESMMGKKTVEERASLVLDMKPLEQLGSMSFLSGNVRKRGVRRVLCKLVMRAHLAVAIEAARTISQHRARFDHPKALPFFRERFAKGTSNEKAASAFGLALLGDTESTARILIGMKRENDAEAKAALVEALGILKTPQAVPGLIALLTDSGAPDKVKGKAAIALARITGVNHGLDAAAWRRSVR